MSITSIASNTSARVAAGVVGIALALSLSFGMVVTPAQAALSQTQIDAIISLLNSFGADAATVNNVKASLMGQPTTGNPSTPSASMCPYTWTRNLEQGATGADVMKLQQFLNSMSGTMVASTGAGSPGMETSTFGPATKAAVMKYQTANSISPVAGYVGPLTRASLNSKCTVAGPVTPTPTPTGSGLMVSSAAQPANGLAVEGASRIPFTKFTVTAGNDGDVTMTGVVVARTGVINKAAFDGVVLLDENGEIVGTSKTLNSNDQATVGQTVTIPRGMSKTFTIAGNMAASLDSYAGQVGGISVVAINTTATVTGALPIVGASHTVNATLTVGAMTAVTSSFDPSTSQSKEIGSTNVRFAGVQLTAGSAEDVRVRSVRWYQTGSASATDLNNIMVNANGTDYPVTVSSDGKYYTATFGSGIVVAKGFSLDVYIKGDIVGTGAANRTVKFNIDKTTDVYVTGEKYGYGITPTASSASDSGSSNSISGFVSTSSSASPWFDASLITITAGSVTSISKANEVGAQNIALNVQNQPLGGFVTDFKGEGVTVQSMVFRFNYSSGAASSNLLTNVSIVNANGTVVAGPEDGAAVAGTEQTVTFTDSVTFPVGRQVYTIKGKLPTTVSNGVTITASTTPSGWTNVKGETTGSTISLSGTSAVTMNAMTVKAAALAITVATTPAAQSIVAGSQDHTFARYQLDATQSGEDVRLSALELQYTFSGTATHLTNCQLFDGSTALNTGSNTLQPSAASGSDETFNLDNSLVVTKGTIKTLDLKCDVSSLASGTFNWGLDSSTADVTVTGVTSNASVTESYTTATGSTMTTAAGSLVVSLDSSSPSYKIVPANSTDVVVAALKFRPANEDIVLKRIGLKLTNTASSSASDLVKVTLWVGSTQIGQATFTGVSTFATSTNVGGSGEMAYNLPADTDTVVTVKADISAIGTNQPAVSGHLVAIDVDTNGTNTQGNGAGSGSAVTASGSTSSAGARIFKSVPTITYSSTGGSLVNGVNDLLVLNIAADAKGEVQLNKLSFKVATTTVFMSAPTFTGPNGNVASSTNVNDNFQGANNPATITVFFDSVSNTQDKVISAGTSKTYTLRATVAGLTGSNSGSVSTALKADTAFPSLAASTFMTTAAALHAASNIIWSPSSTTTVTTSGNDWTNGYGLPGCFATSGLGNDCTARVLAN